MLEHSKIIKVKSIEDITLIYVEVKTYKWSPKIADFNYEENRKVLNTICTIRLNEQDIVNILYVASLIELLGSKYITFAINLHKHNFMIADNDFSDTIGKYIDWQTHTASSYTIMMRKATQIMEYKYKVE